MSFRRAARPPLSNFSRPLNFEKYLNRVEIWGFKVELNEFCTIGWPRVSGYAEWNVIVCL